MTNATKKTDSVSEWLVVHRAEIRILNSEWGEFRCVKKLCNVMCIVRALDKSNEWNGIKQRSRTMQ